MQRKDVGINSAGTIGGNRDLVCGPYNLFSLQYLQTLSVEIDDLVWVVREQKIVLDPCRHPPFSRHQVYLVLEVLEVLRMKENVGGSGADPQLQVA